jgi:hypothetical protein
MARDFEAFKEQIERAFLQHPVVTDNQYCQWFRQGELDVDHLRHFIQQFSVFSNLFLIAALLKVINADSLQSQRESKEILMNELGVIYRKKRGDDGRAADELKVAQESATDPALVSTEGTVDGGIFRFQAGHFEWLLKIGETLGLSFHEMGKRGIGTRSTLFFTDELARLYGSPDYNQSQGAGFAVENWAAAGFWKDLIAGLEIMRRTHVPNLHLGFFTFHDKIEGQHKEHVWDELRECFDHRNFREETFLKAGVEMLDGVKAFWDGLYRDAEKAGLIGKGTAGE